MLIFLEKLLDTSSPLIGWAAALLAVVVTVLLLYLGIAMCAALFCRDEVASRRRLAIFNGLLALFSRLLTRPLR